MIPLEYQGIKQGKQITDFIAGVSSPIQLDILFPNTNSGDYRSKQEFQNQGYETYACTVFSANNCKETLFNYYIKNGIIDIGNMQWLNDNGYLINGEINFSDRLPAQYAEIQYGVGTYQYKANDAVRKWSVPEAMCPYTNINYFDNSIVTQEMINLSDEFNKRFTFNWYWVENPAIWLMSSPLQATVKFATGDPILKPYGNANHAIEVYKSFKYNNEDTFAIEDSYAQTDKVYGKDYVSNFVGYSLTINNNTMDINKFILDNDLKFVRNTNTGAFGRVINKKLRVVNTLDRGTLLLLDNEHRENGTNVTDSEWQVIPKENF